MLVTLLMGFRKISWCGFNVLYVRHCYSVATAAARGQCWLACHWRFHFFAMFMFRCPVTSMTVSAELVHIATLTRPLLTINKTTRTLTQFSTQLYFPIRGPPLSANLFPVHKPHNYFYVYLYNFLWNANKLLAIACRDDLLLLVLSTIFQSVIVDGL